MLRTYLGVLWNFIGAKITKLCPSCYRRIVTRELEACHLVSLTTVSWNTAFSHIPKSCIQTSNDKPQGILPRLRNELHSSILLKLVQLCSSCCYKGIGDTCSLWPIESWNGIWLNYASRRRKLDSYFNNR